MKKLLGLVVFGFALLFTVGIPIQTSAFAQLESKAEVQEVQPNKTFSRKVTETYYYPISQMVPVTRKYNKNSWSGTLQLKSMRTEGTINKVVYEGTVTCSGTCPLPLQEGEEK